MILVTSLFFVFQGVLESDTHQSSAVIQRKKERTDEVANHLRKWQNDCLATGLLFKSTLQGFVMFICK